MDRCALTKKQRQEVLDKSGGVCWYCGCDLPKKGWHADHFEPVLRTDWACKGPKLSDGGFGPVPDEIKDLLGNGMVRPENDKLENIVPACAPCNLFKSAYKLEFFREEIAAQIERVRSASSGFRIAERMGIIESKPSIKVVFWFERQGL